MLGLLRYALILVCPVMMFFMMRRGHGHGGEASGAGFGSSVHGRASAGADTRLPLAELRRQSDELNAEIVLRELETHDPGKAEQ